MFLYNYPEILPDWDIKVSKAHANMLYKIGILTKDENIKIQKGLDIIIFLVVIIVGVEVERSSVDSLIVKLEITDQTFSTVSVRYPSQVLVISKLR